MPGKAAPKAKPKAGGKKKTKGVQMTAEEKKDKEKQYRRDNAEHVASLSAIRCLEHISTHTPNSFDVSLSPLQTSKQNDARTEFVVDEH